MADMGVFGGAGGGEAPTFFLHLNAACRSTTPQYRRIYNFTAMDEYNWHNCN